MGILRVSRRYHIEHRPWVDHGHPGQPTSSPWEADKFPVVASGMPMGSQCDGDRILTDNHVMSMAYLRDANGLPI